MALTPRTILVTTDFSYPAKAAACQAALLAQQFGSSLALIHVLPYPLAIPGAPEYGVHLGEWFTARADEDAIELQEFFAKELGEQRVHYVVVEGDPAQRIVEYARANDVDLIVMPAYGQGPFRRFLLGSVTAKVLNDVDCPVWTGVHRQEITCSQSLDIRNVVCAVTDGGDAPEIIEWGRDAAAAFSATLSVVHVVPGPEPSDEEGVAEARAAALTKHFENLLAQMGVAAQVRIAAGDVAPAVCRQLEELDAGLLIIGRSPKSAMFGRLPTTAYEIVRDSRCSVVAI